MADTELGRGLLIIFSDGLDTASWLTERAVIDAGRRSEVVVYAVSSGAKDPEFLRELTDATGGRLYQIESTRDLRRVFSTRSNEFRQRYLLSYTPQRRDRHADGTVEVQGEGTPRERSARGPAISPDPSVHCVRAQIRSSAGWPGAAKAPLREGRSLSRVQDADRDRQTDRPVTTRQRAASPRTRPTAPPSS